MLYVKTNVKASEISGYGLFAAEHIKKDTVVWKYEPAIDILLSEEDVLKLSEPSKEQFFHYAFLDKYHKKYMLCGDDARFFNHSTNNNCDDGGRDITIALRDIIPGEELTVDYSDFYDDLENHPELVKVSLQT